MYRNADLKKGAEKFVKTAEKKLSRGGKSETTYHTTGEKGINESGEQTTISMSNGLSSEKGDMAEIRDGVLVEQALKNSITAAEEEKGY